MKFEVGQAAVVTGAASGIGYALAEALCERGLSVMLADVEQPALAGPLLQLRSRGYDVDAFTVEVSDAAQVAMLASATLDRFGRIDMLVNSAGVGGRLGPFSDLRPGDWAWTIGVNLIGVANCIQSILPSMVAQQSGHIVNIASLAGLATPPFMAPYVASKHAVVGLSQSLAVELSMMKSPVQVSVVCPGAVRSRIVESERNRPERLREETSTPPELLARLRAAFDRQFAEQMEAAEAAGRILDGVERNVPVILTHPENAELVRQHLAAIENAVTESVQSTAARQLMRA